MKSATQYIILGVFIFFLVVAVLVFAAYGTGNQSAKTATAVIWGTLPASLLTSITYNLNAQNPGALNISYREIAPDAFEQTLIEALAEGTGPDAVLMSQELLFKNEKKLSLIPFTTISERTFKDSFIEGAEVLLSPDGIYGLPFLVDPLVMYWNRDILASKNIAKPPQTWEELLALSGQLTELTNDKIIKKSAVAFGDYVNVLHAKDILSALMLQAGSKMVVRDATAPQGAKNLTGQNEGFPINPVVASLSFYTQFANPLLSIYSWNRSLPNSMQMFANGDLAMYFGMASDLPLLRGKNPNLNFDVAALPQPQSAPTKKTFGNVYSFSILTTSKNKSGAFSSIALLTSSAVLKTASDLTSLPSADRGLLSINPGTATGDVFFRSALWTKNWLDPNPAQTDFIFHTAVDSIVTGKSGSNDAAAVLTKQIDEILR